MATVTTLRWSLASTLRRPEGWIAALVAIAASPAILALPRLHSEAGSRSSAAISYELAFWSSLAGASLGAARLATLGKLDPWFTRAQRWTSDATVVLGHAIALGIGSLWLDALRTSRLDWKVALTALALTAIFWAGIVRLTRSLGLSAIAQVGVLSATAVLATLGAHEIPSLPLLRAAHGLDAGTSNVMTAALAGDVASIISLFLFAWCVESPLLRRS